MPMQWNSQQNQKQQQFHMHPQTISQQCGCGMSTQCNREKFRQSFGSMCGQGDQSQSNTTPKGIAFMALLIVPSGIQSPTTLPEDGPFGQFTLDLSCIQSRISDLSLVCLCSSQTLTYCHNKRNACHSQT